MPPYKGLHANFYPTSVFHPKFDLLPYSPQFGQFSEICDVKNAGDGELFVQFMGPAEATNKCRDNTDGTCSVEYVPTMPGDYTIGICYGKEGDKQHIPGGSHCEGLRGFILYNAIIGVALSKVPCTIFTSIRTLFHPTWSLFNKDRTLFQQV